MGCGAISSRVLNSGTTYRGQLHTPVALLVGKAPPVALTVRLDGPYRRFG
jgi:hypothetical protein